MGRSQGVTHETRKGVESGKLRGQLPCTHPVELRHFGDPARVYHPQENLVVTLQERLDDAKYQRLLELLFGSQATTSTNVGEVK